MTGSAGSVGIDFSSFQVDRSCGRCGGLIAEPGKVYGYAGKWCHCTNLDTGSIIRRAAEARDAEDRRRRDMEEKRRLADTYDKKLPPIHEWIRADRLPAPELTAHDFVVWLRGFFAGRMANPADPHLEALLRETLARVRS
jgi:hypothetical protein